MGACGSILNAEAARSHELDEAARQDYEKLRAKVKLLLLGTGESGKSTILKQMRILYGRGYSEEDRRLYRPTICANVCASMKAILRHVHDTGGQLAGEVRGGIWNRK
jgi:GTPase SAR1 family protein